MYPEILWKKVADYFIHAQAIYSFLLLDTRGRQSFICSSDLQSLTREHREPGLTDWNTTLWVFRVTQNKNNGVFHLGPIAL